MPADILYEMLSLFRSYFNTSANKRLIIMVESQPSQFFINSPTLSYSLYSLITAYKFVHLKNINLVNYK